MDSELDTRRHIKRVGELLTLAAIELLRRANCHDDSKLEEPEKSGFDQAAFPKDVTYGSDEYKECLRKLAPVLEHHYQNNSHHPEYYPNGVNGMDLFDLIEMFFDWKAAGERHTDGNIHKSIKHNTNRFSLSEQLVDILNNTAKRINDN